jgi:hypothetical protein
MGKHEKDPEATMTTPTTPADQTYVASERGLMITVLIMVVIGAGAVLMMMS